MEKYEFVKDIGDGDQGMVKLMCHKETKQLFAVKYIPRGKKTNHEHVAREIMNHRSLCHPSIIGFKEVFLTPTHIAIVLEYAGGGDLFDFIICNDGCPTELHARYYFQQIISGVSYCHNMDICHRDLKLENILLLKNGAYRLKICDFGLSKSYLLHSRPHSKVGTINYIAPEVFSGKEYDGKLADVWSCGVMLYIMLVKKNPFEDEDDTQNYNKIMKNIMAVDYKIPKDANISQGCADIISRILVADPAKRISMKEIKSHPWFLENLPKSLEEGVQAVYYKNRNPGSCHHQSEREIMDIVNKAKTLPLTSSNYAKTEPAATSNNAKNLPPATSGAVVLDLERLNLRSTRGRSH